MSQNVDEKEEYEVADKSKNRKQPDPSSFNSNGSKPDHITASNANRSERKLSQYDTKSTTGYNRDELVSLLNENQLKSGVQTKAKERLDSNFDETQLNQVVSSFNKDTYNSGWSYQRFHASNVHD